MFSDAVKLDTVGLCIKHLGREAQHWRTVLNRSVPLMKSGRRTVLNRSATFKAVVTEPF